MSNGESFFDFAANVGITKHIGSIEATERLIELCHMSAGSTVLDVGCGVGVTPCYLAKKVGCRVVGVDILPAMIERSTERAQKEGVMERVEFKVADVQALPFEDERFDAVISESVTAFPADKQKAVNEYARVTRSGGYVGLNESTWLKTPPPPELIAWASQDLGANVKPLITEEWVSLLVNAGLEETVTSIYHIDVQSEGKGLQRRYGWGGMLAIYARMLRLYSKSPAYREFVKRVRENEIIPPNLGEYFGYGIYVGRKAGGGEMRGWVRDAHGK